MKDLKGCLRGLARMLSLVRGRVLLCGAVYLVEAVCALAFVWYSKKVIDIVTGGSPEPLMASVCVLVGIMAIQLAARIVSRFVEGKLTVDAKIRMRSLVFDKAMRSTWQGRERFHSADVVNRLEEDIRVLFAAFLHGDRFPACRSHRDALRPIAFACVDTHLDNAGSSCRSQTFLPQAAPPAQRNTQPGRADSGPHAGAPAAQGAC